MGSNIVNHAALADEAQKAVGQPNIAALHIEQVIDHLDTRLRGAKETPDQPRHRQEARFLSLAITALQEAQGWLDFADAAADHRRAFEQRTNRSQRRGR